MITIESEVGRYMNFTDFDAAIKFSEVEYGYEGEAWKQVKNSNDFYQLEMFLNEDGIFADVEEN
ncbi:hypothetical protein P4V41_08045 [Fictibacillus nanhaiensis]|uniref:hypothetical protein n=1 Tax=Fictibacillus nanhaiensis TaxID=742169 RepID=UPI002E2123E8|nr:hypothetical protein [Fictibacillus nanhaiensis]